MKSIMMVVVILVTGALGGCAVSSAPDYYDGNGYGYDDLYLDDTADYGAYYGSDYYDSGFYGPGFFFYNNNHFHGHRGGWGHGGGWGGGHGGGWGGGHGGGGHGGGGHR